MPERHLTIAAYAAGASLAAITLVYVFAPTFFLDDGSHSSSSRKRGAVGLVNPANDCFINSVLQALAGLPNLRTHLIREVHRRELDGMELYSEIYPADQKVGSKPDRELPDWMTVGLQQGLVTSGLKEVLDALNERPIYRKTMSAQPFIRVVEHALRTRISRSQQDAQEFLQVIAERLAEEYRSGQKVRAHLNLEAQRQGQATSALPGTSAHGDDRVHLRDTAEPSSAPEPSAADPVSHGHESTEPHALFPMEGKLEAQVECSHCHFKPKPSASSFLTLTLNVPHNGTTTTLNACLDGMFKVETIEGYRCDRCRLHHALDMIQRRLARRNLGEAERASLESDDAKLKTALDTDPEDLPKDVTLPDLAAAPTRTISRHTRLSQFPAVLSIHLSRSIWDPQSISSKNTAKVSFPEVLSLGGLLNRKTYRLLGVVTHKGGHNSGHYETFRRQSLISQPFSTPASFGTNGIYSVHSSPNPSQRPSIVSLGRDAPGPVETSKSSLGQEDEEFIEVDRLAPSDAHHATSYGPLPSRSLATAPVADRHSGFRSGSSSEPSAGGSCRHSQYTESRTSMSTEAAVPANVTTSRRNGFPSRKKAVERWWKISDDKIKECKTSEVLSMQREVYMLFYELTSETVI